MKILEAVPNFSEGRDLDRVGRIVECIARHDVEVLDWSADPDHHRSVVTFIGAPDDVEAAAVAAARVAVEEIDLREHQGVHPRVGALDVLPFVPLADATMDDAVAAAFRAARAVEALGVPVFLYGEAARHNSAQLASLRRGGFEVLAEGWPQDRRPDMDAGRENAHPTAGCSCIGARPILLAWNVVVADFPIERARALAAAIRERGGGFPGLRALGLHLERQQRVQISMNLEDPFRTSPIDVFAAIEEHLASEGGRIVETEVIGMMPDTLVQQGSADRLHLLDPRPARVLSHRVAEYVSARARPPTEIPDVTE
jgi:glutamate formiminotransferase